MQLRGLFTLRERTGARARAVHSRAASRQHCSGHAAGFFTIDKFDLAGQDLIHPKVDLFIPCGIDFYLLGVTDLLERERSDLALIDRESAALSDVVCELRGHSPSLPLRSDVR